MNNSNVLTFEELECIVEMIVKRSEKIDIPFYHYTSMLKNTGMRPVEVLEKSRFSLVGTDTVLFQPSKKNNIRTIPITCFPDALVYYYFGQSVIFQSHYYKRFQRVLFRMSNTDNLFVDGRSLGLYVFRYYYVRKLYVDGMSLEDITAHMGWKNQFLAFKYVTRPIYIKI